MRDNISAINFMREKNIVCGIHYEACHENTVYNKNFVSLPKSSAVAKTTLSIPFNEKLELGDVKYIVECVRQIQ